MLWGKNFFNPRYNFFHNSTDNKRGVGLLLSNSLQHTVLKVYSDKNNNIFGMKTLINNVPVLLSSVYGPNTNNNNTFFQDLRNILAENLESYVVCAGDWNLTYCTDPPAENIDIINMNAPPSIYRSRLLAKICEEYNLMDPYRLLHHKARDFTFVPRASTKNRSRLDFFLVS
jgi:exonuclease III